MTKKELIITKALALFSETGYENTGIKAIVDAAEVTKPTLYHYFGSKDGLLESIYTLYFNNLLDQLNSTLPYEQDTIYSIEQVISVYIQFAKNEPVFFWLYNHLRKSPKASPARAIVKPFYDAEYSFINQLLITICSQHDNLKGQEAFLTLSLLSLILGYIEVHLEDDLSKIKTHDCHRIAKQFLYGIYSL